MVLSALAAVIVVALFVASRITLNDYSLTPGQAQSVVPLITVPPDRSHPTHGSILLTDVSITQLSALGYLAAMFDSNAQIVSSAELLGPDTPADQLVAQGFLEMAQSQQAAKAAALTALGYSVPEHDGGVIVFGVQQRTPAAKVLSVGQTIQAVGTTPTPNPCALLSALSSYRAGQTVQLTVEQSKVTPAAVIVPGQTAHVPVRLAPQPPASANAVTGCPGVPKLPSGYLGVVAEPRQDYTFPFKISVDTTNIGGPSAGLAMTLGIIDKLAGGHLTGGQSIAATGTIAPNGAVGEVGGVPQKTVAVERARATVFFVPPAELAAARSKAVPQLRIFAVASLQQALNDLRRLGGTVPSIPQGHAPTP